MYNLIKWGMAQAIIEREIRRKKKGKIMYNLIYIADLREIANIERINMEELLLGAWEQGFRHKLLFTKQGKRIQ